MCSLLLELVAELVTSFGTAKTRGCVSAVYHRNGATIGPHSRALDEFDVFVRDKRAVDILHKVVAAGERPFEELVSGDTPFGLATNFSGYTRDVAPKDGQVRLYANVGTTRVRGAMARETINKNSHLIDVWKLFYRKPALDESEREAAWTWC